MCVQTGANGWCSAAVTQVVLLCVFLFASRAVAAGAARLTRRIFNEADLAARDLMTQKRRAVGQTGPIDSDVAKVALTKGAAARSMAAFRSCFYFCILREGSDVEENRARRPVLYKPKQRCTEEECQ